jgi:site-specific recombinase XerD
MGVTACEGDHGINLPSLYALPAPDQPVLAQVTALTSSPTWSGVVEAHLSEYANHRTQHRYRADLSLLLRTNAWDHPHQVTLAGILSGCTAPTARGPRANNSVRVRIATARQFLDYCRDHDIPAPNVTRALNRLREPHPKLLGKIQDTYEAARINPEQLQRLYAACSDGTWLGSRDQLALRLLALGLRNVEARTLTWSAIQHDGFIQTIGKGGKLRQVYPGPTLTAMLSKWRTFYERNVGPATGAAALLVT